MSSDKATTFRAQDVNHTSRVCHTPAETKEAVEWLNSLESEGRVLSSHISTNRYGPDVVEATWIAMP